MISVRISFCLRVLHAVRALADQVDGPLEDGDEYVCVEPVDCWQGVTENWSQVNLEASKSAGSTEAMINTQ